MSVYKKCYMCYRIFAETNKVYIRCKGCKNLINTKYCKYKNYLFNYYPKVKRKEIIKNEKLKDNKNVCAVCYINKINAAFIPCGHLCCCYNCALECNKKCPICRSNSVLIQKIYYI